MKKKSIFFWRTLAQNVCIRGRQCAHILRARRQFFSKKFFKKKGEGNKYQIRSITFIWSKQLKLGNQILKREKLVQNSYLELKCNVRLELSTLQNGEI